MGEPVFYSAEGTSCKCAQPNFDYLYSKYPLQRNYRVKYLYDEYAQACERAGERPYSFSSFTSKKAQWRRGQVTKTLPPWYPGERLCCYWSRFPEGFRQAESGKGRHLFIALLPYSEYAYACASKDQTRISWIRCCIKAYRFFGGVPHVTECEPLVTRLSKADRFTQQAFAAHYRTVLFHPCPKTQKTASKRLKPLAAKCDAKAANHIRARLLELSPETDAAVDECVARALAEFNNANGSRGISRREVFETHEAPQLLTLPEEDYDMSIWVERHIGEDYHFRQDGISYSVPYQYAHERVRVRVSTEVIEVYAAGNLIARHDIPKGNVWKNTVTDPSHRPPGHTHFANRLNERFMILAKEVGPATGSIMMEVLFACSRSESKSHRPCKELLDLQNMPSGITLEEACMKVLERQLDMTVESVAAVMQAETR